MVSRTEKKYNLIVVKIGTSSISGTDGLINKEAIVDLARQAAMLRREGIQVILVTSGAIGAGLGKLALTERPQSIAKKQALAAVGQGILMGTYEDIFSLFGITVAQILLSRDDFAAHERYLNAHNTLLELLRYKVLPIINENDTITFDELKFGDNDRLAALVAGMLSADLLVILSDVDGFYTGDPRRNPDAKLLPVIEEITPQIKELAGDAGSKLASGGMISKVQAAEIAASGGVPLVIASSAEPDVLLRLQAGEHIGTLFCSSEAPLKGKKNWLAYSSRAEGKVFIDEQAAQAILQKGSSLLPSGITGVEGEFSRGTVIAIFCKDKELARGLTNYGSADILKIKGLHSSKIDGVLQGGQEAEVVHRDRLSIIG